MKAARDIQKRIDQKLEEVQQLKGQLTRAEAYLEALQESLRLIQKESSPNAGESIRPGSMVYKAKEILRKAGEPLHVEELLRRMGRDTTKNNRASLSGSLGTYVREKNVFSRPLPNTFGLLEFDEEGEEEIPSTFGQ